MDFDFDKAAANPWLVAPSARRSASSSCPAKAGASER